MRFSCVAFTASILVLALGRVAAGQAPAAQTPPRPIDTAGRFETSILAGGSTNDLLLIDVQPQDIAGVPRGTITWETCGNQQRQPIGARSKTASPGDGPDDPAGTLVTLYVPEPPCRRAFFFGTVSWPIYQDARIRLDLPAPPGSTQSRLPFESATSVSVRWFPLAITFTILSLVYPGCAVVSYYLARRRYRLRAEQEGSKETPPGFLQQLDPVQITANAYGRGSLPKLQIFAMSIVVFGLLLYYQFRNGILSGLSEDVLFLLGISAVGTVGGRITYAAKRRISLDNFAWLRRRQWMPHEGEGIGRRALWRELVVDPDSNEFDPYSFQMAIFSVVVAVALVSSSVIGLATFEIPGELLGLLGLSQAVFIAGKAAEKSPFVELDERLRSVRAHERSYQTASATAAAANGDAKVKADADAQAATARASFKTEVAQAADMFVLLFGDSIPRPLPAPLLKPSQIEPEV